ncbi:MAG TPA: hypothetical protein VN795_05165 [Stellaceae bacterium]|nr:hypothetical protein [Stellaceae bacterium]
MKSFRALTLVLLLAGLLAGCGSWAYKQEIEVLRSDQNGITIRAGSAATPDKTATLYCQGMRKLMVPKGADVIDKYQKVYFYACL